MKKQRIYEMTDLDRLTEQAERDLAPLFARVFGAEAALVRHSIACGTHALTIGLFALLRPGDLLLSVAGKPYDTLDEVIGKLSKA